jgi:hypothetical protein
MAELLREALDEMTEAAAWYEERREGLGERFLDIVQSTLRRIDDAPLTGAPWRQGKSRSVAVRRYPVPGFPFVVVYVTEPALVVIAIAHTRRRAGYWRSRIG